MDPGTMSTSFFFLWGGTYVTRYCGHFWPIVQPQMIDEGDCGAIGGMKLGRGNRSTQRKPAPAPFCPPQIPLDQTRAQTRAAAVGSQRLTAWAMARPYSDVPGCAVITWACDCTCCRQMLKLKFDNSAAFFPPSWDVVCHIHAGTRDHQILTGLYVHITFWE
jgi:hypothetical protein